DRPSWWASRRSRRTAELTLSRAMANDFSSIFTWAHYANHLLPPQCQPLQFAHAGDAQPGEPTAVPAAAVLRRAAFQDALAGRSGHDLRRGDRAAFPRAHQAAARRRVRLVGRAAPPARGIRRGGRRPFSRRRKPALAVL